MRLIPAELNEAFFQSVSAEYGEVTDESALRERISGFIEQYNDNMTRVQLDNTLYKYLIEQTSIDLPDQFLENGSSTAVLPMVKTKRPSHNLCRLKESLIFRKVQQEHQLEATQDEIIQAAVQHVRNSYGQLGEDFVRYIVESQPKERSFVESMHDRVMQEKFLDVIRNMISIDDQATTLEEYQSLQKKLHMPNNEFKKFATRHMGIPTTTLESYMQSTSQFVTNFTPYIIEERQLNAQALDVFLPPDDGPHHLPRNTH